MNHNVQVLPQIFRAPGLRGSVSLMVGFPVTPKRRLGSLPCLPVAESLWPPSYSRQTASTQRGAGTARRFDCTECISEGSHWTVRLGQRNPTHWWPTGECWVSLGRWLWRERWGGGPSAGEMALAGIALPNLLTIDYHEKNIVANLSIFCFHGSRWVKPAPAMPSLCNKYHR